MIPEYSTLQTCATKWKRWPGNPRGGHKKTRKPVRLTSPRFLGEGQASHANEGRVEKIKESNPVPGKYAMQCDTIAYIFSLGQFYYY